MVLTYDEYIVRWYCRMRANPGGLINPADVVGRDPLIEMIWERLEEQSVQLLSERRIGKTSVARKMTAEPRQTFLCFFRDLEDLNSLPEFVEAVYADGAAKLGKKDRFALGFKKLVESFGGTEIAGVVKLPGFALHWKKLFSTLIEDLCREDAGRRVVFFWDELPLFVFKLYRQDPNDAMTFLDVLRGLRQTHPNVRMVYTGSIGLHTVLDRLHKQGYANRPVNDMIKISVLPLAPEDGAMLASRLIAGGGLRCEGESGDLAESVSRAAGHIPFYVHWIIWKLAEQRRAVEPSDTDIAVESLIVDPADPAEFRYFEKRLGTYYEPEEAALAKAVLNVLAREGSPIDLEKTANLASPGGSLDLVREILRVLAEDHYVERGADGYAFRSPLIKRWWRWQQG